jgi:hypothetical protein
MVYSSSAFRNFSRSWSGIPSPATSTALPFPFDTKNTEINGAVLRAAGDDQYFQVALAAAHVDGKHQEQAFICLYSSKTGLWEDLLATPIPYQANKGRTPTMVYMMMLCWLEVAFTGSWLKILLKFLSLIWRGRARCDTGARGYM